MKVRTVNFSNCDDDFDGYNPELYILKTVTNKSKVINNYNVVNRNEKLNDYVDGSINGSKRIGDDESVTVSNMNSDDESYKCEESGSNSDEENTISGIKSGDASRNIDEEDYYGPTFFQRSTHWVCFKVKYLYTCVHFINELFVLIYSQFIILVSFYIRLDESHRNW